MALIAAIVWIVMVSFGPIVADFWTEVGLSILGVYVLFALGAAAEK